MNRPSLHFAFNEAWILEKDSKQSQMSDEQLMASSATGVSEAKNFDEKYPDGRIKVKFSGGVADDGRFLLDGAEKWYYEDGSMEREANYKLGRKVGMETYWSADGKKKWTWEHKEDGSSVWTQYRPNGQKKSQSTWKHFKCDGAAMLWDSNGKMTSRKEFSNGEMKD